MAYDLKIGDNIPRTEGLSEIMELTGYYPIYLFQEKTHKIPNFVDKSNSRRFLDI